MDAKITEKKHNEVWAMLNKCKNQSAIVNPHKTAQRRGGDKFESRRYTAS